MTRHILTVLKGVLFIGISIQTVLGIVWMCCNFAHVPQFGESFFYMQVSRTLRCDEYTGILYPLFLWSVRRNHYVVYVIQLAAAYAASHRFLEVFLPGRSWKTVWGSLGLVTIPIVLQCHMAMLPCSFAASLLLLALSLLAEAVREEEKRTLKGLAQLSSCWLLLALLLPEYLYLGAVPVVLFYAAFCRVGKTDQKSKYYGLLLAAAFAGMAAGVSSLTRTEGAWGRLQKTPLMTLTQRVAWSNLLQDYEIWPEEMQDYVETSIIWGTALYADDMYNRFFPAVEQSVSDGVITSRQAEEFYLTVTKVAWNRHKSVIIKEIAWDMLGYAASPAFLQLFLMGRGYDTGIRNYDFFLEHTPELSKLCMDYGSWWFCAAAGLAAAVQGLQLLYRLRYSGKAGGRGAVRSVVCCTVTAGVLTLWYTAAGAGLLDYKKTAVIAALWMAWAALSAAGALPAAVSRSAQTCLKPDGVLNSAQAGTLAISGGTGRGKQAEGTGDREEAEGKRQKETGGKEQER